MALTVSTVDLAAMDKECSALGGLFQQVVTDMKVSAHIRSWDENTVGIGCTVPIQTETQC